MTKPPTRKIKLLIVDDIAETRENLSKLLYFEPDIEIVGAAANGGEAIEQAKSLRPDIVLMDINMPDMDGITTSQEINRVVPSCQVIMMSVQSEADYLRRSMLAGAMDFLTKPFTSEELTTSIHRVYEMGASRRAAMPATPVVDDARPDRPQMAARGRPPGGKLLLIYSPKGGTGCSTVAVNLGIALGQVTSRKVALVDANLQFGDLEVLLNLQGGRSITNATARLEELDSDMMAAILSPHPSGLQVLAAPPTPETSETITPEDIKAILELLRKDFDYVLMDTASHLDDIILAAMDLADRILIVMTPEIPSIKSTKQFFEIAEALQFPTDQIDLVLNKVLPRDGIRPEQLESSIKHEIRAQLIFDPRSIRRSTNQGLPLIVSEPSNPLAESLVQLAELEAAALEPPPAPEAKVAAPLQPERKKRSGLFGRLRR
jgi:pilus assembly protein CpaE